MPLLSILICNIFLFFPFLRGDRIFIGNPDRLNSSLAYLFQFADGRRQDPVSFWSEAIFGGFDCGKVSWIAPGPLDLVLSYFPQDCFFMITLGSSFLLFNLLGVANYYFFYEISGKKWVSTVVAGLVNWSYISVLRITQNDFTYAVLVASPLLLLSFRKAVLKSNPKALILLAFLAFFLGRYCFLQEVAYVLGFALLYGAAVAAANGGWTRFGWCVVCVGGGLLVAAPRIYSVASEMNMLVRREASLPFEQLWQFQNIRPWEVLRFFDNTVFGRTHAENSLSGVNFSEGFQLFSSQIVPFILLAGLVLFWRQNSSPRLLARGESMGLGIPLACAFGIVLSSTFYWLVYLIFGGMDFTHTRLGVAAVTPLGAMVVYAFILLRFPEPLLGNRDLSWLRLVGVIGVGVAVAGLIFAATSLIPPEKAIHIPVGRYGWTGPDQGRMIHLRWQSVVSVFLTGTVFFAGMVFSRKRDPILGSADTACFFAVLALAQAFGAAKFQIRGPHTMTGVPFYQGNSWHPSSLEYRLPDPNNATALRERLESDAYRTVVIASEKGSTGITANSISFFWGLRGMDGYAQGVPKNLAWLPWGKQNVQLRQIHFSNEEDLPWTTLAACNVKYAIKVTQKMLEGQVNINQLGFLQNPIRPCPRVFAPLKIQFCTNPQEEILKIAGKKFESLPSFENISWAERDDHGSNQTEFQEQCQILLSEKKGIIKAEIKKSTNNIKLLVFNERYDPNWVAWSAKGPLKIKEVNGFMVGVFLKGTENAVFLTRQKRSR